MKYLNREHDVILYRIIQKIRNHEALSYMDIENISMIRHILSKMDVEKLNEAQCANMCDIAGKLFYIDSYGKG